MLSLILFPCTLPTPHLQVDGQEWSFGYCERGSGVYTCTPRENPMYTFRSAVELGPTSKTSKEVRREVWGEGFITVGEGGKNFGLLCMEGSVTSKTSKEVRREVSGLRVDRWQGRLIRRRLSGTR